MRLDQSTWYEIEAYLEDHIGIILPVGSIEQHGPIGLIGTDAFCAEMIADAAGDIAKALVAPTLAYTPAPFNMSFPGTISVSEAVFTQMFAEIVEGLRSQGFGRVYVLNAHGANLAPMRKVVGDNLNIHIRSWWDFAPVNDIRNELYGEWEGMHATPSEISITQTKYRQLSHLAAEIPPRALSAEEKMRRAGDNHGPADLHRSEFPDGRVSAHSALASPEAGARLLELAARCVADDFQNFIGSER